MPLIVLGMALGISGCRNSCQQLCQEMADFADEECAQEFPKEEVKACMNAFHNREITDEDKEVCDDITPTLREEWTCDDISDYFDNSGGNGSSGGNDSGS